MKRTTVRALPTVWISFNRPGKMTPVIRQIVGLVLAATVFATVPAQAELFRSKATGLLGAPLPDGATLVERTAGDVANGRDPRERYALKATTAEIVDFYVRAMLVTGWSRHPSTNERSGTLFFRKGRAMIGVLVNSKGNTFTLMGS